MGRGRGGESCGANNEEEEGGAGAKSRMEQAVCSTLAPEAYLYRHLVLRFRQSRNLKLTGLVAYARKVLPIPNRTIMEHQQSGK